jgi:hypothetical protein
MFAMLSGEGRNHRMSIYGGKDPRELPAYSFADADRISVSQVQVPATAMKSRGANRGAYNPSAMHPFRHATRRLAIGALLVQCAVIAALAVAPAFCCEPVAARVGSALPDCCKGDGHSCPLKKLSGAADGEEGSRMRGCVPKDERIASLLFGAAGVLVSVEPLPVPAVVASLESASVYEPRRLEPADSPPPRA